MRKISVITILFFLSRLTASACDICGCGVGNNYVGILPDFNKHIIGLRLRYNALLTHVGVGGSTSYLTTDERYRTVECWGGWNIGKRFRVMGAVPYSFAERSNQGIKNRKSGIGDITLSGYFQVFNKKSTVHSKLLLQNLWLGAGIKLPAGSYNPVDKANGTENANLFQLGTGSTDFTLNALYDIRLQDAGISTSVSYKLNTSNRYHYAYGDKITLNTQAYYKFRIKKKWTIAPNAGILYENGQKDIDNSFSVDISGGSLLMGMGGVELTFKTVAVGGSFQHPMSQQLANGIIKAKDRAMVHIAILL